MSTVLGGGGNDHNTVKQLNHSGLDSRGHRQEE